MFYEVNHLNFTFEVNFDKITIKHEEIKDVLVKTIKTSDFVLERICVEINNLDEKVDIENLAKFFRKDGNFLEIQKLLITVLFYIIF